MGVGAERAVAGGDCGWMQWQPDRGHTSRHRGWVGVGSREPDKGRTGWLMYGDVRPAGSRLCYAMLALTARRLYCRLYCPQMELRYNETERARQIYERYVKCLPSGACVPQLCCCTAASLRLSFHSSAVPGGRDPRNWVCWAALAPAPALLSICPPPISAAPPTVVTITPICTAACSQGVGAVRQV